MKKLLSFTLLFLLLFNFAPCFADTTSYNIDKVDINAVIMDNGDVNVTEYLTYNFSGDFNGFLRDLNSNGSDGCLVNSVSIIDESGVETIAKASNTGEENTYEVSENGYNTNIKLYSKSSNEKKTFKVDYTAKNAAKRYSNNGQLYWDFYTVENIPLVKEANLNISFNNQVLTDQNSRYETFGDGELSTNYINNGININYKNLSSLIGIDLTIPDGFLSNSSITSNESNTEWIENPSHMYENNNIQSDAKSTSIFEVFAFISLSSIVVLIVRLIVKQNKKYNEALEAYRSEYNFISNIKYMEPPSNISPALVNLLIVNKNISSEILSSTLFYLCNLGFYTMEEYKYTENGFFNNKEKTDLRFTRNINKKLPEESHLKFIITWFSLYETNNEFSLSRIKNTLNKHNDRDLFLKQLNKWKLLVEEDAKLQGYFTTIENKSVLANEFYNEKLKWISYRNFIEETINFKERLKEVNIADTILIYAKAVGINNRLIETYIDGLINNVGKLNYDNSGSFNYVNSNYYFINYLLYMNTMNSIYHTAMPNDSSITSTGGGFTGGSSGGNFGGGGGGGSGAF